jgi:hypothetical protein
MTPCKSPVASDPWTSLGYDFLEGEYDTCTSSERNITSDQKAGIGAWKDADIARAIRSGITPTGRVLHWQGMIWDHASNWDEEDVRAIIAYVRLLPPVSKEVPPARPPGPDDCEVYTFWIAQSSVPGCH